MIKQLYNLTRFPGIHTHLMTAEAGELYAQDIKNLRVNRWGQLTAQVPVKTITLVPQYQQADDIAITGVAFEAQNRYFLRSDSTPVLQNDENLILLIDADDLSGRLSVQSLNDLVFLTSEGDDQGYTFNKKSYDGITFGNLSLDTLSVPKPDVTAFTTQSGPFNASYPGNTTDRLFYAITYSRGDLDETEPVIVSSVVPRYPQDDGYLVQIRIISSKLSAIDSRVNRINIYRSVRLHPSDVDTDDIQFYRVGTVDLDAIDENVTTPTIFQDKTQINVLSRESNVYLGSEQAEWEWEDDKNDLDAGEVTRKVYSIHFTYIDKYGVGWETEIREQLASVVGKYLRLRDPEQSNRYLFGEIGEVTFFNDYAAVRLLGLTNDSGDAVFSDNDPTLTNLFNWFSPFDDVNSNNPDVVEILVQDASSAVAQAEGYTPTDLTHPLPDLAVFPRGETLTLYNDRLWTTVDGALRSSDIRDGVPIWSNWPQADIIPTQTDPIFCARVNQYLVFGGPSELWSLIGTSRYNYQINRIGSRGPVSAYAWGNIENAIGFVGTDGFYVTDGATAQKISQPLDGFFDSEPNTDGFVVNVPQGTVWGTQDKAFIADKEWTRLDTGEPIVQGALQTDGNMLFTDGGAVPQTWDGLIDEDDTPTAEFLYTSQEFDAANQGAGSRDKSFKWFEISGTASQDITVTIYVDREQIEQQTFALDGDAKVGINCWGKRIQFQIRGEGDVEIEGVRLYYLISQRK